MSTCTNESVTQICLAVGRLEIREKLSLSKSSLSNAESAGLFPSSWYLGIAELCEAAGVDCPDTLFSWRKGGVE
jgi:hypothetical protein